MTNRILTTHTGSLPRTAESRRAIDRRRQNPGQHRAQLKDAVREAVAGVVRKQVECGIDIINDGEQGRTDYTVHVLKRLTGYEGESAPPMGTGEPEFPSLRKSSSTSHRHSSTGPPATARWLEGLASGGGRHRLAKAALEGAKAKTSS